MKNAAAFIESDIYRYFGRRGQGYDLYETKDDRGVSG